MWSNNDRRPPGSIDRSAPAAWSDLWASIFIRSLAFHDVRVVDQRGACAPQTSRRKRQRRHGQHLRPGRGRRVDDTADAEGCGVKNERVRQATRRRGPPAASTVGPWRAGSRALGPRSRRKRSASSPATDQLNRVGGRGGSTIFCSNGHCPGTGRRRRLQSSAQDVLVARRFCCRSSCPEWRRGPTVNMAGVIRLDASAPVRATGVLHRASTSCAHPIPFRTRGWPARRLRARKLILDPIRP